MSAEPLDPPGPVAAPVKVPRRHPRDQAPVETENVVLHEYDGIQEYDNALPKWWLYTLYATMAFALIYWFDYQVLKAQPSSQESFQRDMAADYAAAAARARRTGQMTDQVLETLARDPTTLAAGHQVYTMACQACHGPAGGGLIGPNLTDAFWLHGNHPTQMYRTVMDGVPAKGMPAWGPVLGEQRVQSAVAFIMTLRNTNVAGGKAPQGDRIP